MAHGLSIVEVVVARGLMSTEEAARVLDPRPLTEPEVREVAGL